MIERKFISEKLKEFQVQEYVAATLEKSGHSKIEIKRTPLGEKIVVYTTRPGLIVGRKGENVKKLTAVLKKRFNMENPQIEIGEVEHPLLDPWSVADQIVNSFERFGTKRFKFIGHNMLTKMVEAGALGAEVIISGKVPSSRAKSWRFSLGHLKKSGDIAENYMLHAKVVAKLKTGIIGVKVSILPPHITLPDHISIKSKEKKEPEIKLEQLKEAPKDLKEAIKAETEKAPEAEKKQAAKKSPRAPKKKQAKAEPLVEPVEQEEEK